MISTNHRRECMTMASFLTRCPRDWKHDRNRKALRCPTRGRAIEFSQAGLDHVLPRGSGLEGIIRHMFPTREVLAAFEQTETYEEILRMLATLRRHGSTPNETPEPSRVITVRLPKAMHDALRVEAYEHRTSMNKLCISSCCNRSTSGRCPSRSEKAVWSEPVSRVLSRRVTTEAMAISLGCRLLGLSSSLPGSRWRAGPAHGTARRTFRPIESAAPCLTLLPVGFT